MGSRGRERVSVGQVGDKMQGRAQGELWGCAFPRPGRGGRPILTALGLVAALLCWEQPSSRTPHPGHPKNACSSFRPCFKFTSSMKPSLTLPLGLSIYSPSIYLWPHQTSIKFLEVRIYVLLIVVSPVAPTCWKGERRNKKGGGQSNRKRASRSDYSWLYGVGSKRYQR